MNSLESPKRPPILSSYTTKVTTGCGSLYVTVSYKEDKRPIEVFAHLGKAGGCSACQVNIITLLLSRSLRYGIPLDVLLDKMLGAQCASIAWDDGVKILSCPDAIAQVLANHEKTINKAGGSSGQESKS
jgi:ribonucleoside-diphosphate reductase alpha chain